MTMKKTLIVNLFGGPGSGKSTAAAEIFAKLKKEHVNVEYVSEYAKDMTWEKRFNVLGDQIYIFAKQYRRISRLFGEVDVIIVDSPLLMCCTYMTPGYYSELKNLILQVWNDCDNMSYFLTRKTKYVEVGRSQTQEEAIDKDNQIIRLLAENTVNVTYIDVTAVYSIDVIVDDIQTQLAKRKTNG